MSKWALVENGNVTTVRDTLPTSWKNVSGVYHREKDLDFLRSLGWYPVVSKLEPYDNIKYEHVGFDFTLSGKEVHQTFTLQEKLPPTPSQLQKIKDDFFINLREKRNNLLRESDWTQLKDTFDSMDKTTQERWKVYRQKLRDLPEQYKDTSDFNSDNIAWPEV